MLQSRCSRLTSVAGFAVVFLLTGCGFGQQSGLEMCRESEEWRMASIYDLQLLSDALDRSGALDPVAVASLERHGRDAERFHKESGADEELATAFGREAQLFSTIADDKQVTEAEGGEAIEIISAATDRCTVLEAEADLS